MSVLRYPSSRVTRSAIVVTGEPVESVQARHGSWSAQIRRSLGPRSESFIELDAREALPPLSDFRALIVTGSAASVTVREPWIVEAEQALARAVQDGVCVLGICFGHQLLGQALGGQVLPNPRGREIGTVRIELLAEDPLLETGMRSLLANMTHLDSVVKLPPGAKLVGRSALEPSAVVRYAERVWGVQFHPEIDATVMGEYLEARAALIEEEGLDLGRLRRQVRDAPEARALLQRFVDLAFSL